METIMSREDYEKFAEDYPELIQNIEDVNYHGLQFRESKPVTENRAMRRAKRKKARD